jgi:hypothetical protein
MAGILPKRAGAKVPSAWLATAIALLQVAYRASGSRGPIVESLLDFFTWQWRLGHTPTAGRRDDLRVGGRDSAQRRRLCGQPRSEAAEGGRRAARLVPTSCGSRPRLERLSAKLRKLEDKHSEHDDKAEVTEVRAEHAKSSAKRAELRDKAREQRRQAARLGRAGRAAGSAGRADAARACGPGSGPSVKPGAAVEPGDARPARKRAVPPSRPRAAWALRARAAAFRQRWCLRRLADRTDPQSARYCLTSADRLIPSHDARRGFVKRDDYPDDVQEREYHRDKREQLKVLSTAQNLIPELIFNGAPGAIDGLPVVTPQGVVLGGNGRTQALQLHYHQGGTARDYLLDHAGQFGFSREQSPSWPIPSSCASSRCTHPTRRSTSAPRKSWSVCSTSR